MILSRASMAAPAEPAPPPPAVLVNLLRGHVADALEGLNTDDPDRYDDAILLLNLVANPGCFPTPDGKWHVAEGTL